jgi:hypothetical protein
MKHNLHLYATHFDTAVTPTVIVCAQGQEQEFRLHPDFETTINTKTLDVLQEIPLECF